jgi:DNA polymerase III alpha subunit
MFESHGNLAYSSARTARNEALSMTVYCREHPLTSLRPLLSEHSVLTARDLRNIPSGKRVRVAGLLVIVHTPPTRSGKRVMFITMEDETGLLDVVVFPKVQAGFARHILTSQVLTLEGRLQRQGKNGVSRSIILERLILPLSGSLADLLP